MLNWAPISFASIIFFRQSNSSSLLALSNIKAKAQSDSYSFSFACFRYFYDLFSAGFHFEINYSKSISDSCLDSFRFYLWIVSSHLSIEIDQFEALSAHFLSFLISDSNALSLSLSFTGLAAATADDFYFQQLSFEKKSSIFK